MLNGKVAIVTGSTSGIGLGIAKELAGLGADLMLNGFGEADEIESIRLGIERDHGVRAIYDGADMSKEDAVRGLIAGIVEKFGRLDILVNDAGIQFTAPVDEFPPAKWDAILAVNLSAAFHGIAMAVPQMKKQRWGRIINIASTHGLVASTHKAAYVAAKHGLVGLTKVVGLETAGSGVTCNRSVPAGYERLWSKSRSATSPRRSASVSRRRRRSCWRKNSRPWISSPPLSLAAP